MFTNVMHESAIEPRKHGRGRQKIHGYATRANESPTYRSWAAMKARCLRPADAGFKHYGGRGITVCKRWLLFLNFLADMGEQPAGLTLERKRNSRGYSKANCVWATRREQTNNRRATRLVRIDGRMIPMADAARQLGIPYYLLSQRVKAGKFYSRLKGTR